MFHKTVESTPLSMLADEYLKTQAVLFVYLEGLTRGNIMIYLSVAQIDALISTLQGAKEYIQQNNKNDE